VTAACSDIFFSFNFQFCHSFKDNWDMFLNESQPCRQGGFGDKFFSWRNFFFKLLHFFDKIPKFSLKSFPWGRFLGLHGVSYPSRYPFLSYPYPPPRVFHIPYPRWSSPDSPRNRPLAAPLTWPKLFAICVRKIKLNL